MDAIPDSLIHLLFFFPALHKLTLGLLTGLSFTLSIDWATSWSWHRDDMEIQPYMKKVQLAKWI